MHKRRPLQDVLTARFGSFARSSGIAELDVMLAVGGVASLVQCLSSGRALAALGSFGVSVLGIAAFSLRVVRTTRRTTKLRGFVAALLHADDRAPYEERALAFTSQLVEDLPGTIVDWHWVNEGVNALISAGLYREALSFPDKWSKEAQDNGRKHAPNEWRLVQLNLAEADYNLGQIDGAKARMDALAEEVARSISEGKDAAPIVQSGSEVQSAWIAALRGDVETGMKHLEQVDCEAIPNRFRAEIDYTRAFLHSRAGNLVEAEAAVHEGLNAAVRPSSERNGLFLLGIILAERGGLDAADRAFERGAAHGYRCQGGDALLRWSEVLTGLHRSDEATQALRWCVERDPQSPAAEVARARLREQGKSPAS